MAIGSPSRTPRSSRAASGAPGAASACSGSSSVTMAFTRGLTAATRARCASITSWAENAPSRIPAASSVAVRPHMPADNNVPRVPFTHQLRVRYGECDPQGIVFNANYLAYFDIAVTELWREAIGQWQTMVDRGVDVVVAEATVRFRSPARFDDVLALGARVGGFGKTSMTTEIEIRRAGEL